MILVFAGLPGTGKGTQASKLSKLSGFAHISTGNCLREKAKNDSKLRDDLVSGGLVSDDTVNEVVLSFLENNKNDNIILDGYPRNILQDDFLKSRLKEDLYLAYFEADTDILLKRVSGRFSCKECGQIYNKYFLNTKIDGVCDICGCKEFLQRSDDNEESFNKRKDVFFKETYPLIERYKLNNSIFNIDASENSNKITETLMNIVKIH